MNFLFFDMTLPNLLRDEEFPVGGWTVQLKHLLCALRDTGHRAGVLTWKGAATHAGGQSVCELVEAYDRSRGVPKLRPFYYFVPALVCAARAFRPDVIVQSCSGVDTAMMAFVARRLQVPFVHRIACDTDTDGRERLYLHRYERAAFHLGLRAADLVICQNEYQFAHIARRYPRKRARILHNAIPVPAHGTPSRPREERTYVAWIGVFKRQKNLGLLLRLARNCPAVQFCVAGAPPARIDGETASWLEELRRESNVQFVGYQTRSALPDFLSQAVALVSTSDYEGFSNAFLEAFAAGTPVVAREAIDPDSMIAQNRLGLVARAEAELEHCIDRIWRMPSREFSAMAEACQCFVRTHHAPAAKAGEFVAMTSSLVH